MLNNDHPEHSYAMQSLLGYLEKEYYAPLERLSKKIADYITIIHGGDVHQTASLYTTLSRKLLDQVNSFVRLRRISLLPYLEDLSEKEHTGHDCRFCSSSCTNRHIHQLEEMKDVHDQIRESLGKLKAVKTPVEHQSVQKDWEKSLRNEINKLDEMLSELIYLEETALIPKIQESQKAIKAIL